MKTLRAIGLAVLLVVSSANAQTVLINGCLVGAAEYKAKLGLRNAGVWARVVRVTYWLNHEGHAYCVFALSNGDLYAYDINNGSTRLSTKYKDIYSIECALKRIHWAIYSAQFLD